MRPLLLLLILGTTFGALAQTPEELHLLVEEQIFNDPGLSLQYAEKELKAASPNSPDQIRALTDVGKCYYYADRYEAGEEYLRKALKIARPIKDKRGEAMALYHLGDLQILQGKYASAIDNTGKALSIFRTIEHTEGIALCMNGIGLIHLQQQNYEQAMTYFKGALKHGNAITKGDSYTNLSHLYMEMEAYADARTYATRALKQGKANDDKYVQSTAYDVLGFVAMQEKNFRQAQRFFLLSVSIKSQLGDSQGISVTALEIAHAKKALGELDSAKYYTQIAYGLADNIGAKDEIKNAAIMLSRLHAALGLYDSAFYYQNRYIQLSEEINSEKASKKMAEMEASIVQQKSKQQIALLEQEKAFETKAKSLYLSLGIIGVVLLTLTVFFFYNRYKLKKKAHDTLEGKQHIIENQNKEILESIRYAQRLQEAILPEISAIEQTFPRSFVTYLPKDIVAGDFYWYEQTADRVMIACCDCTGHGVPGAILSVVCSNAMNRVVRELKKTIPGEILDETRRLVVENFNQSAASARDVKDGMDVSLLVFDKALSTLQYAGAHHDLWILRKDAGEFEVLKGENQPVGKFEMSRPFRTHDLEVHPGDRLYLFSDGYADQFGGERGKKMKVAAVRKLLSSIREQSVKVQQETVETFFREWKGAEPQVDDVCFMALEL
jgi:serine phosphatase RsbU (regulator of sigma subunit)/tetratricopeptide (TPR) repeat protein